MQPGNAAAQLAVLHKESGPMDLGSGLVYSNSKKQPKIYSLQPHSANRGKSGTLGVEHKASSSLESLDNTG